MKYLILILLLFSLSSGKIWRLEGKLESRIIEWEQPVTDWAWIRAVYHSTNGGKDWIEFKNCIWTSTSVKINDWFMLGYPFLIILCDRSMMGQEGE